MTLDDTSPEEAGKERFAFTVNGVRYTSHDAVKDGRQLLQVAGFRPAPDHVLIKLNRPGSTSIGLDEELDLATSGREEFRAFKSDRVFRFTLDDVGYEWGDPAISEEDLRSVSDTSSGREIWLERTDAEDERILSSTSADLAARSVERFYSANRLVTVYYVDEAFEIERGRYTGIELATRFSAPSGYVLDLLAADGEFQEIGADERIKVREGMHFVAHPPCGQSS